MVSIGQTVAFFSYLRAGDTGLPVPYSESNFGGGFSTDRGFGGEWGRGAALERAAGPDASRYGAGRVSLELPPCSQGRDIGDWDDFWGEGAVPGPGESEIGFLLQVCSSFPGAEYLVFNPNLEF